MSNSKLYCESLQVPEAKKATDQNEHFEVDWVYAGVQVDCYSIKVSINLNKKRK